MRAHVGHCQHCDAPLTIVDGQIENVEGLQLIALDLGGPDAQVVPHWNWCRDAIPNAHLSATPTTAEQIAQQSE